MTLVKRLQKGSPLTAQEMDDNLDYLFGIVGAGTNGSAGSSGLSGSAGTSGTGGISGTSGSTGTAGSTGSSGISGTSGVDGTFNGSSGTSGIDGTDGTGANGTSGINGTSGTSPVGGGTITVRDTNAGTNVTSVNQINFTGASVAAGSSGTAIVTVSSGTGGGSLTFTSASLTVNTVSTVQVGENMSLTDAGGGSVIINARAAQSAGGGTGGSNGTSGTSGSGGSAGTSAIATPGTSGVNGSNGTSGSGTNGSPGVSGTSGTNGAGGTNGTAGSSGSSGVSTTLTVKDTGITEVTELRFLQISGSGVTLQSIGANSASIFFPAGGSANWNSMINIPVGIVSSSLQVKGLLPTGIPSGTLQDGYFWVGENGVFAARPTSSIVGGGGSGVFTPVGSYYTTNNYLEIVGGLLITESIGVGSQTTHALTVTGSVDILGSVSASALHVKSVGQPFLTSPSSINLQASSGSVNIISSVFRLASYSDAQTSSLIAQNGDMIYNTTSNKFVGYANGAWVGFH